jgi:hypothetical protein
VSFPSAIEFQCASPLDITLAPRAGCTKHKKAPCGPNRTRTRTISLQDAVKKNTAPGRATGGRLGESGWRRKRGTDAQRQSSYQRFLQATIPEGEWRLVRDSVQRGQLTGDRRFVDKVEEILGSRIEHRSRGRPTKRVAEPRSRGVGQ